MTPPPDLPPLLPPDMPPPTPPSAARPTLAQECGLAWPRPALAAWPPDAHLALALLLAVPVWLALGLWVGPHMLAPQGWLAWALFVAVQPLVEELVFRGALQGQALRLTRPHGQPRRLGPVTLANVLVTLGFVALHLRAQPLAWALAVAVPSLVLGHLRERFASVWPAVAVHAFYNAGFGLTAWLARG
ncbi:MAG: JDVT-CTERM system CAAX-type protease [Burkholderiales bacterium]|nr:JDVT-CTERM system CAAX-type protease [Burkholderiales bacterium]